MCIRDRDKIVPNIPSADASVKGWLAILDQLEPLKPRFVVPDHGALGDGSLIGKERAFLGDLQTRSLELKRKGKSADEAASIITAEFKTKYPDWQLSLIHIFQTDSINDNRVLFPMAG